MARAPKDSKLDSRSARLKLKARRDPYWRQVVPGLHLGYRRVDGAGSWIARRREASSYKFHRVGMADDHADADGTVVLSYTQAVDAARRFADGPVTAAPRHHGDGWTVSDCIDHYFKHGLAGARANDVVRVSVDRHTAESIGSRVVRHLRAADYREWLAAVAASPVRRRGKEIALDTTDPEAVRARKATANRVWGTVRASIDYAWANDQLIGVLSPEWHKVSPLDLGESPVPRMLTEPEIKTLMAKCDPEFRALVSAALATGARYGELCRLKVGDYARDDRAVRIRQTKSEKTLWQPLTDEGIALFERLTDDRPNDAVMLTRKDGTPWAKSEQHRRIKAAATAAKVGDISFKVTRATYGKLLLLATRDIELVAKALGHSDSRVTRKHYAQYLPNEVAEGVRKMGALGIE